MGAAAMTLSVSKWDVEPVDKITCGFLEFESHYIRSAEKA